MVSQYICHINTKSFLYKQVKIFLCCLLDDAGNSHGQKDDAEKADTVVKTHHPSVHSESKEPDFHYLSQST